MKINKIRTSDNTNFKARVRVTEERMFLLKQGRTLVGAGTSSLLTGSSLLTASMPIDDPVVLKKIVQAVNWIFVPNNVKLNDPILFTTKSGSGYGGIGIGTFSSKWGLGDIKDARKPVEPIRGKHEDSHGFYGF